MSTPLIASLESVRRRVRVLSFAYGLGVVLAAAVGLLLAVVTLDYMLNLPPAPRVVVDLGAVGVLGYALVRFVVKPALSKLSLGDVAGRVERAFPQFEDRLRSTVNFTQRATDVPGSEVMKTRVVSEATTLAGRLDLNRAVIAAPAWYSLGGAGGAVALMLLLALTMPLYRDVALSRIFRPFADRPWPKRVRIELTGTVPPRVPVGEKIDVRMRLAKGDTGMRSPRKATIFYQSEGGAVQQELMTRGVDGIYAAALDARIDAAKSESKLKVWITAGDDRTDLTDLTVVPRLAVARVEATVVSPAYAGSAVSTTDLSSSPALVVAGSLITLHVTFNKPVDGGKGMTIGSVNAQQTPPTIAWAVASPRGFDGQWTAKDSVRFHLTATDTDGFRNSALEEYELIVRPDQAPSVQIENPRRNEERTAESTVPLVAVAEDDFGISALTLAVERLGDHLKWEVPLVQNAQPATGVAWARADAGLERLRYRMNYPWVLAGQNEVVLQTGDVLEYALAVRDNYDLNGLRHPPVSSGKLRVTIISQEELTAKVTAELRAVAAQLGEIKKSQDRTKQETNQLQTDTEKKPVLDAGDRALADRLTNQQATVATQTKTVAARVAALRDRLNENLSPNTELKELTDAVEKQLNSAAENPMKSATTKLNAAKEQTPADKRNQSLTDAQREQQNASDQIAKVMERLGDVGSLQQTIDKINALLSRQKDLTRQTQEVAKNNLGKKPEQMTPEERKKLEKISEEQQNLGEQTEKAINDMLKQADAMSKSSPQDAEAMKKAAETGRQQQVSPAMSRASKSASQNQQGSAQAAQKQAELGLEMILSELKEAERRKLEELAKKLAELQEQVATLIRRQAGHNLDDLTIQGPDRLKKLTADTLKQLIDQSQRDVEQLPPPPSVGQLTSGQEQTERNTRDVAHGAEDVQDGAESAALLTRAAGRMERAIVELRAHKMDEAYDPSQVEALASLVEAAAKIDEQKKKVDDKRNEQTKESIRQAFIRIKADQEKLNADTTRLDAAPRDAQGLARRDDALRLGQLPGEQGKLGADLSKVGENLSALGGVVYVWANKDIVATMDRIKEDLNAKRTGVPVRAEQKRVVEQLDAMIRNLAVKPPEDKFATPGGGGGGSGSGGTPLPPEAELRLLKELQISLNNSTKTIAEDKRKGE